MIRGQGGGDGGLFAGILARYLALAARRLPPCEESDVASEIVLTSADACWDSSLEVRGDPLFGPEWTERVPDLPVRGPARDLSVQVGAWILLEAAASLG